MRNPSKESEIVVVEERPMKTDRPILLTGFQDMGLIGVMAISHIIGSLKLEEVGYLKSRLIPTIKVIVGSEFRTVHSFRLYRNSAGNMLVLLNDSPTGLIGLSPFFNEIARVLADWLHKKDVRLVVALGSYLLQKDEKPVLVAFTKDSEKMEELKKLGVKPLQQGVIGGLIVSIIDECIGKKIPWLMLFAPTTKIGEVDSEGIRMILDGVNKMMGLNIEAPSFKPMVGDKKRSIRSLLRR